LVFLKQGVTMARDAAKVLRPFRPAVVGVRGLNLLAEIRIRLPPHLYAKGGQILLQASLSEGVIGGELGYASAVQIGYGCGGFALNEGVMEPVSGVCHHYYYYYYYYYYYHYYYY
jgi:hypothetical protein